MVNGMTDNQVFTTVDRGCNRLPMRWERKGVMHACEGSEVHRGVTLIWTRCGKHDVPANAAWTGHDDITCDACKEIVPWLTHRPGR